ncbi:MAG TPA: Wzz/FepE/Etk N-terminal domain-containing protein [Anaerolineae bacterium]|nr:Wzz/FepE/Etk N-terminal domain-containing protein [Anaerolineae bacterium]
MDQTNQPVETTESTEQGGRSILAILRRRWWIIALFVVGAVVVTAAIALTAAPVYRSSLRMQAQALDAQDVTLYTRLNVGAATDQIAVTQANFNDVLRSSLVAWRTINDLGLSISADTLLAGLETTQAGDFVSVSYEGSSPQEAMDVLNKHVENALAYYNELTARPAAAAGQFIQSEAVEQAKTVTAAQDALLQFQLEHNVGDLPREINAVQDVLRDLESRRDAALVDSRQADALARQYTQFAADSEDDLTTVEETLATVISDTVEGDAIGLAEIDRLQETVAGLRSQIGDYRSAEREQQAAAAALRAVVAENESLISQHSADLTQLIGLSSEYNALVNVVGNAQGDQEFLRAKAVEARLKEAQSRDVGALQVVEPAFLPSAPANPPVLRLILLAGLVSLLLAVVVVLLLELARPG